MHTSPSRPEAGLTAQPHATSASATGVIAALAALITDPPTKRADDETCSSTPNAVLLKIQTDILISDYSNFYTTPIDQFTMSYTNFPDGSLVATPLLEEAKREDQLLLFTGMMLMFFSINTIISIDYTRRGRVRFKGLFYALILSQIFAVVYFTLLAIQILDDNPDCERLSFASSILGELSSALLLSGILGTKAYKCLNDSKTVIIVVGILQAVSSALSFVDLARTKTSLSSALRGCVFTQTSLFYPFSVALRFVIALFICLCFIYALWKSARLPAAQGRISLRFSPGNQQDFNKDEKHTSCQSRPRGWWDYVPELPGQQRTDQPESRASTWHLVDDQGFVKNMRYLVGTWLSEAPRTTGVKRKGSEATLVSHKHPSRPSFVHFKEGTQESHHDSVSRSLSPTPSRTRSLGVLTTRMKLFREVMRNELAHTALITLLNVIATIIALVGAFGHLSSSSPIYFSGTYWAILSLLVVHSFGRVVARHEREALLQHPSAWDPLYYVEKVTNGEVRPGLTNASVASNPWRLRSPVDPLSVPSEEVHNEVSNNGQNISDKGKEKAIIPPNGNPFEDFVFAGPSGSTSMDKSAQADMRDQYAAMANEREIPPDQQSLSTLSSESVSRYSGTSMARSLFYLEGYHR